MRRVATFGLVGPLNGSQGGTLKVERATGLVHVRAKRQRRVFTLPLETVARIVIERTVKAEIAQARAARVAARKGRSR